ncbi:hypothetical protein NPIL_427511 [Nephila pilipes]|uniref:Uncharacterized protein n=1 Tax=Nephila pilipes TaxID=299642 RepID=A0A8X6Q0N4_NEPPI|nr:hypothetical protein NPIL_427511 [Nephila pilipes]
MTQVSILEIQGLVNNLCTSDQCSMQIQRSQNTSTQLQINFPQPGGKMNTPVTLTPSKKSRGNTKLPQILTIDEPIEEITEIDVMHGRGRHPPAPPKKKLTLPNHSDNVSKLSSSEKTPRSYRLKLTAKLIGTQPPESTPQTPVTI